MPTRTWAVCAGHGWHHSRRIVHLDNGHWCYRDDVASVEKGATMTDLERLLALAEGLGLEPEDLDMAVHDLAQEVGLAELNAIEDEQGQEDHIGAQEAMASAINNGGLGEQLQFLLEHNSYQEVELLLRGLKEGA